MSPSLRKEFRILFFLYLAGVLFLCFWHFESTPSVTDSILGIPTDKIAHFCMFVPFPVLAFLAFDKYTEKPLQSFQFVGITLLAGILLAFFTEWGQSSLTTWRNGDPWDFVADVIGITAASAAVLVRDLSKQKK